MGVFSVQAEEMALTNWADNFEFDGANPAGRAVARKRPGNFSWKKDGPADESYTRSPFQRLPATMRKEKVNKSKEPWAQRNLQAFEMCACAGFVSERKWTMRSLC
jgi:hypothetical protein